MPTQKPRIELVFQDDAVMFLYYSFKDRSEYVAYKHMSGNIIPENVVSRMLPKMLEGLAKKISPSFDEAQDKEGV